MSLINVKELGYGVDGKTLDITIAIPTGSYLKGFWVCNQKEVDSASCSLKTTGVDYIEEVKKAHDDPNEYAAFNRLFTKTGEETDPVTENTYEIYKINHEEWSVNFTVSQEDLNLITMELDITSVVDFEYPTECGEDSSILTVPLCNLLLHKLALLNKVEMFDECSIPRDFMNGLLEIKTIGLALCCKDYCKALYYWGKFFGKNKKNKPKKCCCNG